MSPLLKIQLFGHPELHLDGQPLALNLPHKALALLYYLALAEQPVGRETVALLLWPDALARTAKHSLRNLLSQLRKVVGDGLEITHRTLALHAAQRAQVDVVAFQQGLVAIQKSQTRDEAPDLTLWQATLDRYRGDFLEGFYIHQSAPFEEWTTLQREALRQQLITNLLGLSAAYAAATTTTTTRGTAAALACLDRLLEIEPHNEVAYTRQIELLLAAGRRTDALQRYERYQQMLADEFDIPPAPALTALVTELRAETSGKTSVAQWVAGVPKGPTGSTGTPTRTAHLPPIPDQPAPPILPPILPTNLAQPLSVFVGRAQELAYIAQRLTDATCRLLTIVGPGGMGKTSLALAAGQRLLPAQPANFPDGIFFVPLVDIGATEHDRSEQDLATDAVAGEAILRAIATQIGYKFAVGISSALQLQIYLRTRRLLLILDNFEHLEAGAAAVVMLLTQVPQLKMLITSRARLNVRGETVLTLTQLSLPAAAYRAAVKAAQANPAGTIPAADWQTSEAIAMFVQRAQ